MDFEFTATIWEWRGPAPFYFASVPEDLIDDLRAQAQLASYGWGVVPVHATANGVSFTTSLFPREGGYAVPLKVAVRRPLGLDAGDEVTITFTVDFPAL